MKLLKPVVFGACALFALSLNAQDVETKKTPEEKAEKVAEKMTEKYSLTAEQAEKVEAIQLDAQTTMLKIKSDQTITAEVKKSQLEAAKAAKLAQMKEVLSAEQYAAFEADLEEKMVVRQAENATPEARAQKQTDRMTESLGLTPDQISKVYELYLKVEMKIDAVNANESFDDAKKREFIKGNKADREYVLKTILTAEQIAKMEELKTVRASHRAEKKQDKVEDSE